MHGQRNIRLFTYLFKVTDRSLSVTDFLAATCKHRNFRRCSKALTDIPNLSFTFIQNNPYIRVITLYIIRGKINQLACQSNIHLERPTIAPFRQMVADLIHSGILFNIIINVPQEHYFLFDVHRTVHR